LIVLTSAVGADELSCLVSVVVCVVGEFFSVGLLQLKAIKQKVI